MNVFVDTNVVLDVFLERHPFYDDSFMIFQLVDLERIKGYVSAAECGVDCIVTRNAADYKMPGVPCMSPADFIAYFNAM